MITGIKNVSLLHLDEGSAIKNLFLFFVTCIIYAQESDLSRFDSTRFLANQKVFHHPEKVLFNSRAFNLEVFTDFDKKLIKQVSLFYRTDSQPRYREISFPPKNKRYSYQYNPQKNPANYITYFFTVELKSGKVFATPIDNSGVLNPITMNLVDPIKYYKERAEGRY